MELMMSIVAVAFISSMIPALAMAGCCFGEWKRDGILKMFAKVFAVFFVVALLFSGAYFFTVAGHSVIGLVCLMGFGMFVGYVTLGGNRREFPVDVENRNDLRSQKQALRRCKFRRNWLVVHR